MFSCIQKRKNISEGIKVDSQMTVWKRKRNEGWLGSRHSVEILIFLLFIFFKSGLWKINATILELSWKTMKATFHFHFLECKLVQLPGLSRSTAPSLRAEGAHSSRATTLETSLTLQCLDSLGQRAPPSRSWRDVKALEAGGKVLQSADRPCSSQGCLRGEGLRATCPCLTFPHLKYWCDAKSVHCS